jgi:hypothetical protein
LGAEQHLRLCFARRAEDLEEAVARMQPVLARMQPVLARIATETRASAA